MPWLVSLQQQDMLITLGFCSLKEIVTIYSPHTATHEVTKRPKTVFIALQASNKHN